MKDLTRIKNVGVGAVLGAVIVGGVWAGWTATANSRQVVATMQGSVITQSQLKTSAENLAGSQILLELIANQLVVNEAKKEGVSITSKQINQSLQSLEQANNITTSAQLQKQLQLQGMTKSELLSNIKIGLMEQKIAQNQVHVTTSQIAAYKKKNKGTTLSDAEIKTFLQQQSIPSTTQLIANLAKKEKLAIVNSKYQYLLTQMENPQTVIPPTSPVPPISTKKTKKNA